MNGIPLIMFHHEDITTIQADLCVCTIHTSKNLNKGQLSSCMLRKAGPTVQTEINNKSQEPLQQYHRIITNPGNLANFTKLMFVYLLPWQNDINQNFRLEGIQQFVIDSLTFAHKERFASVAFPALGMGGLSYPPYEVSMAMLTGIARFYNTNKVTSVSTVHVALLGPNEDSVLMYIQSTKLYIDFFKKHLLKFEVNQQLFNVQPSTALTALMTRPLAKVKSTWQKFLALFSTSDPVPKGELFRVEVRPLRRMYHKNCKHSFENANSELKVQYLSPIVPQKTSNWVEK